MPLSPTDQLHLNTAARFLQIGELMDAWTELERITPLNRAKTEVLTVRLAVCRALKKWELAEEVARTLIKRGRRAAPAAFYECGIDRAYLLVTVTVCTGVALPSAS